MNKTIYLPDTNLLFNLAESIVLEKKYFEHWHRNSVNFWKRYGKQTQIPSLVWAEFCGLWFHKNVDLGNYDFWFRNRISVFLQMYQLLKRYKVNMCDESNILFQNVLEIASEITSQKMPENLIKTISKRINQTILSIENSIKKKGINKKNKEALERNKKNLLTGKILDGLDSVIVTFAYEFAKKNSETETIIVSDDKFMVETVNYFYDTMEHFKNYVVPDNVSAYTTRELVKKRQK